MVAPSRPSSSSSSSSSPKSSYLVLAVKILLMLIILLWLPRLVFAATASASAQQQYQYRRRHTHQRVLQFRQYWQNARQKCEVQTDCAKLIPEEALNCIHSCLSPPCYERVYATTTTPLEDGEIDLQLATDYETCLQEEFKLVRERQRDERRQKREQATSTTSWS